MPTYPATTETTYTYYTGSPPVTSAKTTTTSTTAPPPPDVPHQDVAGTKAPKGSKLHVPKAPYNVQCPHCSSFVLTTTSYSPGALTWILFVILLIIFWPICWIPFLIKECKDVVHTCPACNSRIGRYSRLHIGDH